MNLIIKSLSANPFFNQSLGSYITQAWHQLPKFNKIMLLCCSEDTVSLGRNQNCWKEANIPLMLKDKVTLIRRDTGGGATYIDRGTLLFSIHQPLLKNVQHEYPLLVNS